MLIAAQISITDRPSRVQHPKGLLCTLSAPLRRSDGYTRQKVVKKSQQEGAIRECDVPDEVLQV